MNHSGFECILVFAECCIGYKSMKSAAEVADSDSDYNVLIYNLHYSRHLGNRIGSQDSQAFRGHNQKPEDIPSDVMPLARYFSRLSGKLGKNFVK